jgi:hypothetical protein
LPNAPSARSRAAASFSTDVFATNVGALLYLPSARVQTPKSPTQRRARSRPPRTERAFQRSCAVTTTTSGPSCTNHTSPWQVLSLPSFLSGET